MKSSDVSTRDQILNLIRQIPNISSHELSKQCDVSDAAVRFHLRNLERTGLIRERSTIRLSRTAGRSFKTYHTTDIGKMNNVDDLCSALLQFSKIDTQMSNEFKVDIIVEYLLCDFVFTDRKGAALLSTMTKWLNAHHYRAKWEARVDGPVLQFENCPYASVRNENPIICDIDIDILRRISGLDWKQQELIKWETGIGACVFKANPTPRVKL